MAEDLARFIDRYTIEYTRTYPHPIERVWRAITDPAEMSVWFSRIQFDARLGGEYLALWEEPSGFKGEITAFEPPRLIRFGGPADHGPTTGYWQFELEPVEGGTKMLFVQHSQPGYFSRPDWPLDPPESAPDTPWRPGTLSGWHIAFDNLGDVLNGLVIGSHLPATPFSELAGSWTRKMQAQGVYTARQAARAAVSLKLHERDVELANAYRELMRTTCRP
jgi:uncharacterized protein YndB with AHSA1/START domain